MPFKIGDIVWLKKEQQFGVLTHHRGNGAWDLIIEYETPGAFRRTSAHEEDFLRYRGTFPPPRTSIWELLMEDD